MNNNMESYEYKYYINNNILTIKCNYIGDVDASATVQLQFNKNLVVFLFDTKGKHNSYSIKSSGYYELKLRNINLEKINLTNYEKE